MGTRDSSGLPVDGSPETYTNRLRFEDAQKTRENRFNLLANSCGTLLLVDVQPFTSANGARASAGNDLQFSAANFDAEVSRFHTWVVMNKNTVLFVIALE
jgi:hypothetical protein